MIFDIREFLKNCIKSRLLVLFIVMVVIFSIMLGRVFTLQIIEGEEYQKNFTELIRKDIPIEATRGNIYDCNGNLLAYNQLAYSVVITDAYANTSNRDEDLNRELAEVIKVVLENGESVYNDFQITLNEDNEYEFNVSGTALKRFLADVFGQVSYDKLEYNKKFGFDEANASADNVMTYLMDEDCFDVDEQYDKEIAYYIVVLRYGIKANRYSQYKTVTVAKDVSDETVAYMNEHSDTLLGVSIQEDTIRKYNYSEYFSSIIGYTGKISTIEYEELVKNDDTYTTNDIVGKSGLEQKYEQQLRGINGNESFYANKWGKKTEEIERTDSISGNDLYLSIDADLQKATYDLVEQEIAGIVYSNIRSGNIPINDVYFALINNNVIDITQFAEDDASDLEKSVYSAFKNAYNSTEGVIDKQLHNNPVALGEMSEKILDCFTYIISMLKEDKVLVKSKIDESDEVYLKWKDEKISPKEYLSYCISKQWIDISLLDVEQKYADSSEIYEALCSYIEQEISQDKNFAKIIYKYMIDDEHVSGKDLCLILFEQGVLDYDDDTVNNLKNGNTSAYSFLLDKINNFEITPAQLALDPCTGSCVITDVKTGEIKALVSYPGYDNNKFSNGVDAAYYASLNEDKSNPLYNYATQERTAPGSTFKMVSATAGLSEGVISLGSQIDCKGIFKDISNEPKCWIYPHGTHGKINVSEAIRDSCNVFFYTVGYKLSTKDSSSNTYSDAAGIKYIQDYAKIFGLDEETGLEIVENKSELPTEYPVMAAIGQSNNNYTTVALSRYVTAVASGKLYDYKLMNKIVDNDGNVVESYSPEYKDISSALSSDNWDGIHKGMRMVCEELDSFKGFDIEIAGKTGTAQQVETRPNHALFVGYVPYDNPELSIAIRIAFGYSSHNAASAARNIVSYYYKERTLDEILEDKAAGVNTSASNSVTD
ncbi:MAG: penicillin-binding transpeptidase domain-containing protein [Agathobacter sp.]|nr:penicillin-binding transpeptidase domain-containing protein [Agathobacter sp.]